MPINPFFEKSLERSSLSNPNIEAEYERVFELFDNPDFVHEVDRGNITHAMIRPEVGPTANLLGLSDEEAASKIESMIEGMGYVTKFSYIFTERAIRTFYGGSPQEGMMQQTPVDSSRFDNRWPEFIEFMTSSPSTSILLYSPNGDAIDLWRRHLGHWNIDENRDLRTIRGQLGVNKYNNLVHGSDSPEAVKREIEIIKTCLTPR